MKRIALVLTLLMGVPAMADTPLPPACDLLEGIDIAATLGAGTTYVPGMTIENSAVRMSLCSADTPDLSRRMTLMARENLAANVPDAATLRAQMIAELKETIGSAVVIEDVSIGDGGIWVSEIGQLTVWHRGGRVMLIFSPTPMQDRAAAEAAAQAVLAAYP
ncbi:hypothetical protein [Rhodalgimonas zhirmunskyi]|uniref:DUF1795 domain-containing protein n=1 Tax=Rhodalgimonas zhirmunskyi TaxID=2964767 RepID=A0AAJ1U304_9RHOB|nr:hypothetical protein [Rhodoalgimonas zhirmunskyi]MDQ2092761.1 hypothetical protein [Rhodoalgimonas zhirmunskyi]